MGPKKTLLAIASALTLLAACGSGSPVEVNVLLVSVDTLNRDAIRAYDGSAPALSNVDRFAEGALRFEKAVTPSSWTLPAHASLLTGLYPDRHGAVTKGSRLRKDVPTLAGLLAEQGVTTVAFTDGGYLHTAFGLSRGFDRYDEWTLSEEHEALAVPRGGRRTAQPGTALFDRAAAWLRERDSGDGPFFLFLQTYSVHDYFKVHDWARGGVANADVGAERENIEGLNGIGELSPERWDALRALYRAELTHLDEGFGRLLAALEDGGHAERTIVVFVSDHGEGLSPERGRIHHGGRLEEDLLRVPMLVSGPGIATGTFDDAVSLADVAPTLLEHLGVATDAAFDGVSVAAALAGKDATRPAPLFAMEHNYVWRGGERVAAPRRDGEAHAVAVIDGDRWFLTGPGAGRLYDLAADPRQERDLGADADGFARLAKAATLRGRLLAPGEDLAENADVNRQLESLGYFR